MASIAFCRAGESLFLETECTELGYGNIKSWRSEGMAYFVFRATIDRAGECNCR